MTTWADLVAAALVGTERRPVVVDLDLLDGVPVEGTEAAVLVAAGVLGTYRIAGQVPVRDAAVAAPAPVDARPEAPPGAVHLLELLLGGDVRIPGGSTPVVEEWLVRCATSHRLPDKFVPAVLDLAAATEPLRGPALAAAGPLARWLAARNDTWAWARDGAGPGRAATVDAREAIANGWRSEPASAREAMVAALAVGLSSDDEPFLEHALDDRARGVRVTAADLLDRLPTSRRAQRMSARLAPLVRIEGRVRKQLVVDLPDEPDDAARRDGIGDARFDGFGVAASRLVRMIAGAPLAWWSEHLGRDVAWLVDHGRDNNELVLGWTMAATRQRDAAWADALLDHVVRPELLTAIATIDPDRAAARLATLLGVVEDNAVFPLLAAVPPPWNEATSRAVIARYESMGPKVPLVDMVAPVLVRRLSPAVARDVERWAGGLPEGRDRRTVRDLLHALTIRRSIAEELA